jgi:hypothetical protein
LVITLQGRPKHMEQCPDGADNDHAVPKSPRLGIESYNPGYKVI